MSFRDIYSQSLDSIESSEQPWYVNSYEGSIYELIFDVFLDTLLISSLLGLLFVFISPSTFNTSIFFLFIMFTLIPLMLISALYHHNTCNYENSLCTSSVKPSFKFIIIYELILMSLFALIV